MRRAVAALAAGGLAVGVSCAAREPARPDVAAVARHTYVVRAGDTLWSIAGRIAPGEDPRPLVDAIARVNGVSAGDLVPGQALVIPGGA